MSDVAKLISANDYRVALAETGEPSVPPAEVNPDDAENVEEDAAAAAPPPKKKKPATAKPKGTPPPAAAAPVKPKTPKLVAPATPAAPASTATKRKTAPPPSESGAGQQAPKRVAVEPPKIPTPKAQKPATPKAKTSPQPNPEPAPKRVVAAAAKGSGVPKTTEIPVNFPNLRTAENLVPKFGVDPKIKPYASASAAAIDACQILMDEVHTLGEWFGVLDSWLKAESADLTQFRLNLVVLIIEMVARRLKTDVLRFGTIDMHRPTGKRAGINRVIADYEFYKVIGFFSEARNVLLENSMEERNLIQFVECCVVSEVYINEPITTILSKADLKLSVEKEQAADYRKKNREQVGLICAGWQLLSEYYAREDARANGGEGEEEEAADEEKAEEDEEDALDAALDFD